MNDVVKVFEDYDINIVLNDNDEVLFEIYSTGLALGYINYSKGKAYPHKVRIHKIMENAEVEPIEFNGSTYMTEEQLYDFMLEAHTPRCKEFKKWIAHEVLPNIRKNKCYITESATQEDIDFESLYGIRRIYDTFLNSNDVEAEYNRFFEMSKAKRAKNHHSFNNQDRIKLSKKIVEALENKGRLAYESREPIWKVLSYQELQTRVQTDITNLSNRHNGGIKAQQTKRILQLESENQMLTAELTDAKEMLLQQQGTDVPFLEIPYYGFSANKMYEPKLGRLKRTKQYNFWSNHFPTYLLKNKSFSEHIDYKKPICVEMYFLTNGRFDVDNFSKSLLDVVANALEINDKVFTKTICCECNEKVEDHYKDGKIFIRMYNYDSENLSM